MPKSTFFIVKLHENVTFKKCRDIQSCSTGCVTKLNIFIFDKSDWLLILNRLSRDKKMKQLQNLRDAIIIAHNCGKKQAEIADFLGISQGSVSNTIKRLEETGSNENRKRES